MTTGSDIPSSPPSAGFRVAPLLLAALCMGLVVWTGKSAIEGELFRIQEVEIQGSPATDAEVARVYASIPAGTPLYDVEVDELRRRLRLLPWVSQVEIKRELPNRLIIQLLPEKARAVAVLDGKRVLVNRAGKAFSMDEVTDDLPVITGATNTADLRLGSEAVGAFATVRDPEELAMVSVGPLGVTIWDRSGVEFRLGRRRLRERIRNGQRVLKEARRRGVRLDRVLLDDELHPSRVVARLARRG